MPLNIAVLVQPTSWKIAHENAVLQFTNFKDLRASNNNNFRCSDLKPTKQLQIIHLIRNRKKDTLKVRIKPEFLNKFLPRNCEIPLPLSHRFKPIHHYLLQFLIITQLSKVLHNNYLSSKHRNSLHIRIKRKEGRETYKPIARRDSLLPTHQIKREVIKEPNLEQGVSGVGK